MSRPMASSKAQPSLGTPAGEFELTNEDFRRIAAILHADSGIALPETKSTLVYSRLAKRLRALGMASFRDYCAFIVTSEGADERMTMLAALTTNVTHFFREPHHFDHMRQTLLPSLLEGAKRGGRVRIWSAGCSNGHEPYSIALTILSMMPDAARHDIKILASDIDPNVVAFGRRGSYDETAIEPVSADLRRRWFAREGDRWAASEDLKALVSFRELNLIGDWPMKGAFDAIFCRNVTIYFDEPTRQRVWHRFTGKLAPRGFVYIGHSERMTGPASEKMQLVGHTTYQMG